MDEQNLRTPVFADRQFQYRAKAARGFLPEVRAICGAPADRGLTFTPLAPQVADSFDSGAAFQLTNSRRDRYDSWDISLRHTFAGTIRVVCRLHPIERAIERRSRLYSRKSDLRVQGPGPYAWDTPNRFHMWGWAPLPNRFLPRVAPILTRNTTAAYLLEYRTGFPFRSSQRRGISDRPAQFGAISRITSTSTYTWNGNSGLCIIYGPGVSVSTI